MNPSPGSRIPWEQPPHGNRRLARVPFFVDLTVVPLPESHSIEGRSIDVSLDGVGVIISMPLPVGQIVSLTFHLMIVDKPIDQGPVVGRVTNVRFDDDVTILGVMFTPALSGAAFPVLVRRIERL